MGYIPRVSLKLLYKQFIQALQMHACVDYLHIERKNRTNSSVVIIYNFYK